MSTAAEERIALAKHLRAMSSKPQLSVHSFSIRSLADALEGKTRLAPWSAVDMVGTFARPDLLSEHSPAQSGRILQTVQSALVFVPIAVTWFGLVLATSAYRSMISTREGARAAAGRSFLELWQEGFGGHLARMFTFGWLALYTLGALLGIVAVMFFGARQTRKAELSAMASRRQLTGELLPALVAAQVTARAEEQDSPARFTAELARAGDRLAALLAKATDAQSGLRGVVTQIDALAHELSSSVASVNAAATDLSRGSSAVRRAVDAAASTTAALERTVTAHVTAGVDRISTVTAEAAERAEILGVEGRRLLEETSSRARAELNTAARQQSDLLEGVAATVDTAVTTLLASTDRLADAGGALAHSLGAAGREGAETIADTYQAAVAAAATSLGREMVRIGTGLADQVEELRAVTERHEQQARSTVEIHTTAVSELVATVRNLQVATERYDEVARQTTEQTRLAAQGHAIVATELTTTVREFGESVRGAVEQHEEAVRVLADRQEEQARTTEDQTRTLAELASTVQELREAVCARPAPNGSGAHIAVARGRTVGSTVRRNRSSRVMGTR